MKNTNNLCIQKCQNSSNETFEFLFPKREFLKINITFMSNPSRMDIFHHYNSVIIGYTCTVYGMSYLTVRVLCLLADQRNEIWKGVPSGMLLILHSMVTGARGCPRGQYQGLLEPWKYSRRNNIQASQHWHMQRQTRTLDHALHITTHTQHLYITQLFV